MNEAFLKKAEEEKPQLTETVRTVSAERELREGESVVLDFGVHCVGYPEFCFSARGSHPDAPALIKIRICERSEELKESTEDYRGWIGGGWIQEETIREDSFPCRYACVRRYAFRYIQIEACALSSKYTLVVEKVSARCVTSAPELIAPVGNTEAEKRIDAVALRTLSECMQCEFEDGPKRDRRLWLGDLRLQALSNYETFRHNGLVKRCLYLFAGTADEEGNLSQCVFTSPEPAPDDKGMFDYSLLFVPALLEYFEATGDTETAMELLPLAEKQIFLARGQFDGDSVRDSGELGWCFLDWSLELNKQAGAQAVYIYSERALARLLRRLGGIPAEYEKDADRKACAAIRTFYDPDAGLFRSGAEGQISYASNVWMTLAGVFDPEENARLLDRLAGCDAAVKPVTPYMMHYYIQALAENGRTEEAERRMCAYWGGMTDAGADTFWELFNPDNPEESPYGGKCVHSYCHAWSCTPSYFIRKYFLREKEE